MSHKSSLQVQVFFLLMLPTRSQDLNPNTLLHPGTTPLYFSGHYHDIENRRTESTPLAHLRAVVFTFTHSLSHVTSPLVYQSQLLFFSRARPAEDVTFELCCPSGTPVTNSKTAAAVSAADTIAGPLP